MPEAPSCKVVHLVLSLCPGGLERLVVEWTNVRNARLHDSTRVLCLDEAGPLAREIRGSVPVAFRANRARWPMDVGVAIRIRRCLKGAGAGPCVIHSHNLAAWQYASVAAAGTAVRHVHTEHGSNPHCGGLVNHLRMRVLLAATSRLVAVSRSTAADLASRQRIPRSRISVVSNGVSVPPAPSVPAAATRESLGIPVRAAVVGTVGRLAAVKGVDRLLRAFSEMVSGPGLPWSAPWGVGVGGCALGTGPAVADPPVLLIVGDGPEREVLERQASDLGLGRQVVLAGFRPDARCLLPAMDLFVLPSRSEGLSVALLEAMAAGVPVLVTDVGENREVIGSGAYGNLLPECEGEWAEAIGYRLSVRGRDESRQQVERAKRRVAEHYSLDATLDAYENVYREVLGKT